MLECYKDGDFLKYFTENMKGLGLDVPTTLFATKEKAIETITAISAALKTLGRSATMAEIVGATTGLEMLMVAGAASASFYLGAAIGSLMVATGRSLSCGKGIIDLFVFINKHNIYFEDSDTFFLRNPEIFNKSHPLRKQYYLKSVS